ncbi:MAG: oligosaccharide flippase family protein [Clostridia bacterium]|nr:oligosaccharide flippase family protein [Clostridia bacterium]
MNRYQKLFSNTVILAIGTFGSKLLVFLLMPLYTAWLTTAQYGAAETVTSVANFLIPIACVGVSTGIFRFAADREADREAVFSGSMALLGLGLGGFLFLSPLLLLVDYFREYVWLIVLYVLFADVQAVMAQYLRATDRTTLFAVQGILNTVLTVLCNVLFLFCFDLGVTGYVLSVVVGNVLTSLFMLWRAKLWRVFHISKVSRRIMWEILRFSLPMIPTTVCWLITDLSDRSMVTYFCGESVNGLYSAAYKIPTIVTLISGIFLQAWQFSAVAESSEEEECGRFYSRVFDGFLSVIMIGSAGLILLSRFLTDLLLNSAYFEAWRYMPTLLCAAALEAIVSFLATVYLVRKKSGHSFVTALVGALSNIILNLLLIPLMGALGAAVATLASYALVMIVRMIDAPRMIRFRLCLPRLIVSVLLLFASAAVMTLDIGGRFWWTLGLTVVIAVINAPSLLAGVKQLLRKRIAEEK